MRHLSYVASLSALLAMMLVASTVDFAWGAAAVSATVNGTPVTSYDVEQRTKLMRLFHMKNPSSKQALEDLINETLSNAAAKAHNMGATDAMVDERFAGIAKQVKLTPPMFVKALASQGVQPDTLKKFIRGQITWGMILQARARQTKVSESDIAAEIAKEGVSLQNATIQEFTLQQIVFVVPKGSPSGFVGQRQRDAEAFRKRFGGCDNSLALAKTMKGVVVLNMGRRDTTQVPQPIADQLRKTSVGGTLKPDVTERGVEVIAVCSVRDIQSTAGIRADAQNKLTQAATKDIDSVFKAELRKNAKISYN